MADSGMIAPPLKEAATTVEAVFLNTLNVCNTDERAAAKFRRGAVRCITATYSQQGGMAVVVVTDAPNAGRWMETLRDHAAGVATEMVVASGESARKDPGAAAIVFVVSVFGGVVRTGVDCAKIP